MDSTAQKTVRNAAWVGSAQAIRQVVSITAMVVLARFLGPTEFGIFAMMVFINELAQLLVDFGMGSAIIQRKEINHRLLSSCFWINLAIGVGAGLILLATGPWIAAYFGQPAIQWLLLGSAANLVIAAASVLPHALLSRELAFKQIALGTLVGSICGAVVAVTLAANGAGVWALVAQPLAGGSITLAYLFWQARWKPTLQFHLDEVRGVLRFSGQLLGNSVVGHVTRNLPSLMLGPSLGAAALGLITMAQTVTWLPVAQVSQAVSKVTLPVFSQLQNDLPRFRHGLYRASGYVAWLCFPILCGLAALSTDLMAVVFGTKWQSAAPLVSALSVFALVQSVGVLSGVAMMALGRGGLLLGSTALGLPVMGVSLWLAKDGSVLGAVWAMVIGGLGLQLLSIGAALRAMEGSWRDYLVALMRPLLCAVLMAVAMVLGSWLIGSWHQAVRLAVLSTLGAALYLLFSGVLNRDASLELLALVRRKRTGRTLA